MHSSPFLLVVSRTISVDRDRWRCGLYRLGGRYLRHACVVRKREGIRLCADSGVRAGFLKKRVTDKLRSTLGWKKREVALFGGRALGYITSRLTGIFTPSYLDEIFFNWRKPSAIVRHIKQMESEFPALGAERGNQPSVTQLFLENDLEPA